ncbi:hypothetical protein ACG04Q_11880 [Roseateles sp. DXS20W]|uniref:Peptidase n=1 Tax=Pelomonas lactea TaxID=3299030 RepID=A0ABW7GKD7_9BURK
MSTASNPKPAAAPESLDLVEVFRPGRRRAMNGREYLITEADVVACAEGYDPALSKAPHVVGHPKHDDPAYGWIESFKAVDGGKSLYVTKSGQVEPEFAEMVVGGRYPNRSMAFYPPDHEANPKPGIWYPKHLGWLGGAAPAVKGLKPVVAYAADDAGLVVFGEWEDQLQVGIFRRLREWFIGRFGVEEADKVLPSYELDALQREALTPEPDNTRSTTSPGFAEGDPAVPNPNDQAALDARAAQLDAREAEIAQREAAQAALVKSARSAGISAFADTMVAEGRWLPAEKARWVAFMEGMPDEAKVVEFGEGDARTETPALEVFQAQMRKAPKVVAFGENAGNERTVEPTDLQDAAAIGKAAAEFQEAERKSGREVSFELAVQHVVTQSKSN